MKKNQVNKIENVKRMLRGIGRDSVASTASERAANESRYKVIRFYRTMLSKAV
jgi:hypothetical protein